MTFSRAFRVLLAAQAAQAALSSATCRSCEASDGDGDATELLQSQISKVTTEDATNISQGALRELAEMLHKAKRECGMKQSQNCLPLLQDLRKRMWPYVLGELAETNASLGLAPNQILEDRLAKPAIFRAALKPDLCNGKGRPMYFVDLTESPENKNKGFLQELKTVSKGRLKLRPRDAKGKTCKRLVPKGELRERRNTFVLIRDPLDRFISGYAAIENDLQKDEGSPVQDYQFLSEAKNNFTMRATLFLHRFFKDGANYSSHVSSMSEHVGSVSSTCRELPKQWFAKVENVTETWKTWTMFLKQRGCKKALGSFSSFNTIEKGGRYEQVMSSTVKDKEFHFTPSDHAIFSDNEDAVVAKDTLKAKSLLAMDALASSHGMAMSQVMGLNNFVYLRAFCWLNLPDYVVFDYALPRPCHREDMDVILKLTKQRVEEDPMMNPGKKNRQNKKNKRKQDQSWSKVMVDPMVEDGKENGLEDQEDEGDGI